MSDTTDPGPATAVLPRVEDPTPAEVARMSLPRMAILPGPPVPVPPPVPQPVDDVHTGPDHSPGAANVLPDVVCDIPGHCVTAPAGTAADAVTTGFLHPALAAAGVADPASYRLAPGDEPGSVEPPAESAADAPTPSAPDVPPTVPASSGTGVPSVVRGGLRTPVRTALITQWLVNACGPCGEWSSLTVSGVTRNIVLTVPDDASFTRWCAHLNVPKSRRKIHRDALGSYVQGSTTTTSGWAITVHLSNPLETA